MPAVPVDEGVRIGHLSNGLTYYLRHNEYPEHVASYYIVQKVGSVNEEEDQRGLAHLLEHLAFNGTDHFEGNSLQNYLQSIGVEYGRNLNAETGTDMTEYYFTDVPTTRQTAVDSCLLILKDWSNGITLSQQAIDDERDVVHNEYRMRMVGMMRMLERSLPAIYPGSKYGQRMPIGLMSVIDGCSPEAIRSYYRKWYRPDNQAVVIVGDINVDEIEAKLKELFGGITVPADAAKVLPEAVPDNNEAIYVVDKDREQQVDMIMLMIKQEPLPDEMKGSMAYYMQDYVTTLVNDMLSQRLKEKAQEPDCPFLEASADYGEYIMSRTMDAETLDAVAKPGKVKEAYEALLTELKRAAGHGFTAGEFGRAKEEFMSRIDKIYSNRDKMKNEEYAPQYVDNFINKSPIPSVETEHQIYQMLSKALPLEIINKMTHELVSRKDTNMVTLVMMQEKDGAVYPSTGELAATVAKVRASEVAAYVDNTKTEPLLSKTPKAGKITSISENGKLGYKELTLSNGARVVLKKTDFKDDEVIFEGIAEGGCSGIKFSTPATAKLADEFVNSFGLGTFSNQDVEKALSGKQASAGLSLTEYEHSIGGSSTPKDIETMMQLIYLHMTALSKDDKAFNNAKETKKAEVANMSNNPQMVFSDSLSTTLYVHNPIYSKPTPEEIDQVNADEILKVFQQLTANASEYTFYFVGNYDEATLLPLIETYLASLPAKGKTVRNTQVKMSEGEVSNIFTKKMSNPQSMAVERWASAPQDYSLQGVVTLDVANRVVDMANNRNIREKLSAAYYAGAQDQIVLNPDKKTAVYGIMGIALLNPDKAGDAIPYLMSDIKEAATAPADDDIQKAKEILLKQADVDAKTNSYWLSILTRWNKYGIDFHTDRKATISAVDAGAVKAFLNNVILPSGNHMKVVMNAEKE